MPGDDLLYLEIKRDCAEAKGRSDGARAELLQLVLSRALSRDATDVLASIRAIINNANKLIADPDIKSEIKDYCRSDKVILDRYLSLYGDNF